MRLAPKIIALLFFLLAGAALYDGIHKIFAYREARVTGVEVTETQFFAAARNLAFTWLFAGIYAAVGVGFWQRRRFTFVLVLLFAILVGQWMNVGYRNGFVLSFLALALMATPSVRGSFRS